MTRYALATCLLDAAPRAALVISGDLHDLEQCWRAWRNTPLPDYLCSIDAMLAQWDAAEAGLESLVDAVVTRGLRAPLAPDTRVLAPFRPARIFGAASNYIEHAAEMQTALAAKADSSPYMFIKASSSVIGPNEAIRMPPETAKLDWEVELGVVIGRGGRRIRTQDAAAHIAGYTIVNDISARDLNRRSDYPFKHDWFRGKSWDTFCPLGPYFVPRACVPDPHRLQLWLDVNGERMQDGSSDAMIFDCYEQIAYLSTLLTLAPGDLIATGTPAGVGMGRDLYLKPGDRIDCGIEGFGTLSNPVVAEELG